MEILHDEILLTEKDLLLSIWTEPKLTFTYIFRFCPKKYITLLLILDGIVNGLERSQSHADKHTTYSITIFVFAILFGGIFGWIFGWFYAALLSWTGRWIKGTASSDQFITVVAWSLVPAISSLILMIPKLLIFGNEPFRLDFQGQSIYKIIAFLFIGLIEFILSIWTIVILVKGIALVQHFSIKKAVWNMVLSFLVIVIPLSMLVVVAIMFR
jgi:hypothetical protein